MSNVNVVAREELKANFLNVVSSYGNTDTFSLKWKSWKCCEEKDSWIMRKKFVETVWNTFPIHLKTLNFDNTSHKIEVTRVN